MPLPGNATTHCTVYPNPTTGDFTLQPGTVMGLSTLKVEMYTIRGEKISSKIISGEKHHTFSLAGRSPGLYLVRVISGDNYFL